MPPRRLGGPWVQKAGYLLGMRMTPFFVFFGVFFWGVVGDFDGTLEIH